MHEDATSVAIIFETHATSLDNERQLAAGHYDVDLSALGKQEAEDLGRRYAHETFAAIYCPDHRRAIDTAVIAFGARDMPIIHDQRLRECDYGAMTRFPAGGRRACETSTRHGALPPGESYHQAAMRMGTFLQDVATNHVGDRILIIGTRATHYGLEHWLNDVPLIELVSTPFTGNPGGRIASMAQARAGASYPLDRHTRSVPWFPELPPERSHSCRYCDGSAKRERHLTDLRDVWHVRMKPPAVSAAKKRGEHISIDSYGAWWQVKDSGNASSTCLVARIPSTWSQPDCSVRQDGLGIFGNRRASHEETRDDACKADDRRRPRTRRARPPRWRRRRWHLPRAVRLRWRP